MRFKEKKLTDEKEFTGCALTDTAEVEKLVAKLHRNLGSYQRGTKGKQLRWTGAPKLLYKATRGHVEKCERMKINGARPLSRPAKFPMASAPFEVLISAFVE